MELILISKPQTQRLPNYKSRWESDLDFAKLCETGSFHVQHENIASENKWKLQDDDTEKTSLLVKQVH